MFFQNKGLLLLVFFFFPSFFFKLKKALFIHKIYGLQKLEEDKL